MCRGVTRLKSPYPCTGSCEDMGENQRRLARKERMEELLIEGGVRGSAQVRVLRKHRAAQETTRQGHLAEC